MASSSSASPAGQEQAPQPGNAYVAGVMRSFSTLTWEAAKDSFDNNLHDACTRKGFLWGSFVGTLLGAHRFKQGGHGRAITRSIMFGFSITFLSQFYMCRLQLFDSKVAMKEYMARQARGNVTLNPEAAGPVPIVPPPPYATAAGLAPGSVVPSSSTGMAAGLR